MPNKLESVEEFLDTLNRLHDDMDGSFEAGAIDEVHLRDLRVAEIVRERFESYLRDNQQQRAVNIIRNLDLAALLGGK